MMRWWIHVACLCLAVPISLASGTRETMPPRLSSVVTATGQPVLKEAHPLRSGLGDERWKALSSTSYFEETRLPSRGSKDGSTLDRWGGYRGGGSKSESSTARVVACFGLWYVLNVWYNVVNKRVLNAVPLPMSVAVAQLGIGSLWVGILWAFKVREGPGKLTAEGARRIAPVALFHGGGQLATVLSLGAGAVSFTHVVKAMEPFFSALVAAVWFRQIFRWQVYAALVPVVAGVSLACYTELNFSWVSFLGAMSSNLFFACRANFSKGLMMRSPTVTRLSAANLYGLVTIVSFIGLAPLALGTGARLWGPVWQEALREGHTPGKLASNIFLSGISHYLNNEVMYLALSAVHPTTLAVGNTMKRVFIITASLVVFKTPISRTGILGSVIGVGGVLVYSLTKQRCDALDGEATLRGRAAE